MIDDNPIYKHDPETLFDGPYLQAAKAIRRNDQLTLNSLLMNHPPVIRPIDPNYVGRQGMTLLLWAASHDNIKAVDILLENGADPNQKIVTIKGDTIQLLAIAAGGKSDVLFDTLLRHNADPNSRDGTEPALFSAILADQFNRVYKLLDAGGDINITNSVGTPAIVILAQLRKYKYVLDFLNRGAKLTDSTASDLIYYITESPLTPAAPNYESQLKVKRLLVDRGYSFPSKNH